MFELIPFKSFKKALKRLLKDRRFRSVKLREALTALQRGEPLKAHHQNHKLIGEFEGYFECHIQPDILLIYGIDNSQRVVYLYKIGSHAELFG